MHSYLQTLANAHYQESSLKFLPSVFVQNFSMMATQKALQFVNQSTKDTVTGYCRRIQKLLDSDKIVPTQIIDLILGFYFIVECFIECGNKFIQVSNERRTIHNPKPRYETAYGSFEIDCDQHYNKNRAFTWKFYIYDNGYRCNFIGIDETKRKWVNKCVKVQHDSINYGWDASGNTWRPVEQSNMDRYKMVAGSQGCAANDKVIMKLNLKDQTLIYYRHKASEDEQKKIQICKIEEIQTENVKYCLAVYLWDGGKVTLTDFCIE